MTRFKFSKIVIHEESGTVDVGAGPTWTEMYKHLVHKGLNVVGGRLNGVGLGGFTPGGGWSCFNFLDLTSHLSWQDIHGKPISLVLP